MQELIKEFSEMKWELKYISKTLSKVEKVLENQWVMLEKQNVANKRIFDLEQENIAIKKDHRTDHKWMDSRVRNLENWQIKAVSYATIFATIGSTIVWIIIKKFL